MKPKVEQINPKNQSVEQTSANSVEDVFSATKRVEGEAFDVSTEDSNDNVSLDPTPQTYSAMQNDFVKDNGVIINTNEFGGLLDQKSSNSYSLDIRNVSNN